VLCFHKQTPYCENGTKICGGSIQIYFFYFFFPGVVSSTTTEFSSNPPAASVDGMSNGASLRVQAGLKNNSKFPKAREDM